MSELKSCPFCGVETYIKYEDMDGLYTIPVDFHGENEPWAIIYAKHKDGCWLNEADVFDWFETADEAIETWNTRAERTCEGCRYEFFDNEILCPACCRSKRDNWKAEKK